MPYVSLNSLIIPELYHECLDSMVKILQQLDRPDFLIVIPSDLEIIRVKRLQLAVTMALRAMRKLN